MKELKNYLHLYLGCEMLTPDNVKCELINVSRSGGVFLKGTTAEGMSFNSHGITDAKLLLRTIDSLTADEWIELFPLMPSDKDIDEEDGTAMLLATGEFNRFLLNLHIDLFGLIEAGLALDKSKIHANS